MKHRVAGRGLVGLFGAAVLLAATGGIATAQGATEGASSASRGATATAFSAQSESGRYLTDGARIHTQPSTTSTVVGYGYQTHVVTVICRRVVAGQEWFYHTDNATGVTGWGRYDVVAPYIAVGNC
ncbi:SH3 domain-containing protein [Streptomyces sp. NPDC050264]|uniref:SH3 domain-containing protein n=1 Tax=Streptomyces sp. NPDC050264 TaxID=3155038 RepID=UPI0034499562